MKKLLIIAVFVVLSSYCCFCHGLVGVSTNVDRMCNLDRRSFVVATITGSCAVIGGASSLYVPAAFGLDDLAMPSVVEQQQLDEAAMAERLRRKAELQRKGNAPKSLSDSIQKERMKQSEMNSQTKEERRNRMCEELGRGC